MFSCTFGVSGFPRVFGFVVGSSFYKIFIQYETYMFVKVYSCLKMCKNCVNCVNCVKTYK